MTLGIANLALVGAVAALAAGGLGYVHGIRVGADQEQAAQRRADQAADEARQLTQTAIDTSAERHQAGEYARQSTVREIYHESEKLVERPIFHTVCIDADGVGLLDRAAAASNGEHIGGPAGPTPGAAPTAAQ